MDKPEVKVKEKDIELKEVLDKIKWGEYIDYGEVKVEIRGGKKKFTAIERTYVE